MVAGMREKWIYDLQQTLSELIGTAESASPSSFKPERLASRCKRNTTVLCDSKEEPR
jgi:hypothetical protein